MSIIHYFINRFIDKSHALTSLSLKRGEFHEIDTRILHCLFDTLVDYIEKELAWFHLILTKENPKKHFLGWRSPTDGLARLELDSSLVDDDGQPTAQALAAREIKSLYIWWTEERPKREDPYGKDSPKEIIKLEKRYDTEDEEMLIRLIKIRNRLWT